MGRVAPLFWVIVRFVDVPSHSRSALHYQVVESRCGERLKGHGSQVREKVFCQLFRIQNSNLINAFMQL